MRFSCEFGNALRHVDSWYTRACVVIRCRREISGHCTAGIALRRRRVAARAARLPSRMEKFSRRFIRAFAWAARGMPGMVTGITWRGAPFRTLWPVVLMNATLSFHSDSPQDEILWFPWTSAAARQTGFATFSKSSISHYSPIASLRLPSSVGRCHESPSHQRWSSLS